jgi:hypothetical protein
MFNVSPRLVTDAAKVLTESPADFAAKVKPQLEEEGRERMRAAAKQTNAKRWAKESLCANLHNPPEPTATSSPAPAPHDSTEQAAEMFNVSRRIVTDASKVLAESPEDFERVAAGELTVHAARTKGFPFGGCPWRAGDGVGYTPACTPSKGVARTDTLGPAAGGRPTGFNRLHPAHQTKPPPACPRRWRGRGHGDG